MKPALRLAFLPALAFLALGAFLVACGGSSSYGSSKASSTQPAGASSSSGDDRAAGASQSVAIVDFAFQPTSMTVTPGQQVTLKLQNNGKATHTFTIDGVVDSGQLAAGESKILTFTPASGTFKYYCKIHGPGTMSGQLSVGITTAPIPTPEPSNGTPGTYSSY